MIRTMSAPRERIGVLDIAIAVIAAGFGVGLIVANHLDEAYATSLLAVPVFMLVVAPLLWRRRAPLTALAATLVALLIHVAAFGEVVRCGVVLPVMLLLVFAAGARLELGPSVIGLAVALSIAGVICVTDGPSGAPPEALLFIVPLAVAVWGIGRLVRMRAGMVGELRARTADLQSARERRARMEVAEDRARLSGELDALLQRRLDELARLAEEAPADPAAATAALARIEEEGRGTLAEMRSLVGLLRGDEPEAETAPQPTLTQLEALVVRARGAGARLRVEGLPRALPAGVELSAYRTVEHLLEAMLERPDVEVTVVFGDDALELRVAGAPRRRAAEAIERARERVRLHGGELTTRSGDGRIVADASLPTLVAV